MTSAAPSNGPWSDAFLDGLRGAGDPLADDAVGAVFARGDFAMLHRFMSQLVSNDELPTDAPPEILRFLDATSALPEWADPARIELAERLFFEHGLVSMAALVFASLPECYVMKHGVSILALTGQLGDHTNRRLHQTAAMLLAVMNRGGLTARGRGIRQTQKVRLIHASIRYMILQHVSADATSDAPTAVTDVIARGGIDWQLARDGYPVNQEDMAYTLLTFAWVIPRAMQRLGVPLRDEQLDAFLHAWNVVGHVLGVRQDAMAGTVDGAAVLFGRIKARQAGSSPGGVLLTGKLLDLVEQELLRGRLLRPMGPVLVRVLVGDQTAGMLGLDMRNAWLVRVVQRAVASAIGAADALGLAVGRDVHPLARLAPLVGRRLVDFLCDVTYREGRPQPEVPTGWLGK